MEKCVERIVRLSKRVTVNYITIRTLDSTMSITLNIDNACDIQFVCEIPYSLTVSNLNDIPLDVDKDKNIILDV